MKRHGADDDSIPAAAFDRSPVPAADRSYRHRRGCHRRTARGCSLNQAFIELVRMANRYHVAPLHLADALVVIAANKPAVAWTRTQCSSLAKAGAFSRGPPTRDD
jgi:hypothetical protein